LFAFKDGIFNINKTDEAMVRISSYFTNYDYFHRKKTFFENGGDIVDVEKDYSGGWQ
jgi:hypothetical protein